MSNLSTELRNKLERTCIAARNLAEPAARDALKSLAVAHHEPYGHMTPEQRAVRNKLWARAKQLGDTADAKGQRSIERLAQECAYEHWHRMLFARFLAENHLLIEPEMRVAVSLEECKELAKEAKVNLWTLAGRFAQTMLPEIFRADDPVLQVPLAREDQLKLEEQLNALAPATFTASDSLGWCYQFWQTERKEQVNAHGNKIGADELPSVTQLFTEDYMVDFLLDNTLGAWWAGRQGSEVRGQRSEPKNEEEARRAVALPGCPWKYLRFVQKDGKWTPAAGTFEGWPKTAKELKCLDPCMGSGHFVVAIFERIVGLRMVEEKLDEAVAVEAVIRENLFGLEIDPRCTQIGAFNLALAAWRRVGHRPLPAMHIACSGLAPNARKDDWIKLAESNANLRFAMGALYDLFQKAPVLGSLINPRRDKAVTYGATLHELQPLLSAAMDREKTSVSLELAVTAQGIAKAAEILSDRFTLVATNVPYLSNRKQCDELKGFCTDHYREAKNDLAVTFMLRLLGLSAPSGSLAFVMSQYWLFKSSYADVRRDLLRNLEWPILAKLGVGAFETISGEVVNVLAGVWNNAAAGPNACLSGIDVMDRRRPAEKAEGLTHQSVSLLQLVDQIKNPESRIIIGETSDIETLEEMALAPQGTKTGDDERWRKCFWEISASNKGWIPYQTTVRKHSIYGGRHLYLDWRTGGIGMIRPRIENLAVGKLGVAISQSGDLPATIYSGERFDSNVAPIIPNDPALVPALWAYCSSSEYLTNVRLIDQSLKVTNVPLIQVPFDIAHWQKVAAEKYPEGLPKPLSTDPTQWLFNGHPRGSDQPLQVAVARVVGYRWPRQTGSSFPDCPALGADGLEPFADDDGIVCIPSVRGEEPAAERLRKLLSAAYGVNWKSNSELELIHATGSKAGDFEEWLRDDFFDLHCDRFDQSPFIWHVWDGRKRDGFHALVNYHALAGANGQGRRTLENLTHSYLGDWITRQKDGIKREDEGADERLAAALALKERLEAILTGEPPFDVFVRWKPLAQQAIGWEPDINDGVRMNIRPFLASDIPGGKKGAGVLRVKPNIKWGPNPDKGNEPRRDKQDFPWFWNGDVFVGKRVNDVHLTRKQKEEARAAKA